MFLKTLSPSLRQFLPIPLAKVTHILSSFYKVNFDKFYKLNTHKHTELSDILVSSYIFARHFI